MGQHLASFREFFRMDGNKKKNSEIQKLSSDHQLYCDHHHHHQQSTIVKNTTYDMLNQSNDNNLSTIESNGNEPIGNLIMENNDNKQNQNMDNEQLNSSLDNHNSRFESIYSQPIDAQDVKQTCNNGNFVASLDDAEVVVKQQEPCCSAESGGVNGGSSTSSNSSSSSSSSTSSSSNNSCSSSSCEDSPITPALKRTSKTLSFGRRKSKKNLFILLST